MTQKYYAIVTNLGAAKIANAAALGTKLNITHMAVGDGNGMLPTPNASQTKLVNEMRRAAINTLSVDEANSSQVIAEQVIPETEGGFWIREMGLFDADGTLIAVCNTPETYKPLLQEGSGRTQTVRMILIVNSTDAITLKIDPSVVLATRKYVDDSILTVRQYADNLLENHLEEENPHGQYLQVAQALGELKDAGLIADVLANLGLGEAAKRDVGTATNQIPDMSSFGGSSASNGYLVIPGVGRNRIIQWGRTAGTLGNTINTVILPVAFPNNFYQVIATHDDTISVASLAYAGASPETLSTFKLVGQKLNFNQSTGAVTLRTSQTACSFRYIAIGD